jgi:hypothetical protein
MLAFVIILGVLVVFQSFLVFQLLHRINQLENAPLDNRARDSKGRYVNDKPDTPTNEAYKKRK